VTIHYRFHPCAGKSIPVIGCNTHCGTAVVVVRQPDGTAAYIPEWMVRPEARQLGLRHRPRLPLGCLDDLRDVLGAILTSLACKGDSDNGGTDVMPKNLADLSSAKPVPPTLTAQPVAVSTNSGPLC
jgi:hypothetical protein